MSEKFYASQMYTYYKMWLNTALEAHRAASDRGDEPDVVHRWALACRRAATLTDFWLGISRMYERND